MQHKAPSQSGISRVGGRTEKKTHRQVTQALVVVFFYALPAEKKPIPHADLSNQVTGDLDMTSPTRSPRHSCRA